MSNLLEVRTSLGEGEWQQKAESRELDMSRSVRSAPNREGRRNAPAP